MDAALEQTLHRCLTEGRASWPDVAVKEEVLVPILTRMLGAAGDLAPVHAADLFLAAASAAGDPTAVDVVVRETSRLARGALVGVVAPGDLDDVVQDVRAKLLTAPADGTPKILTFSGRAPLASWLRAVVLRAGISFYRSRREIPVDETEWLVLPVSMADARLEAARRHVAPALRAALDAALAALSPRERTLLRQHFLDGLSAENLGVLYGVHRVTTYRWIAEAKRKVLAATRLGLERQLGLDAGEVDSVLRLARSSFSITIERLLAAGD